MLLVASSNPPVSARLQGHSGLMHTVQPLLWVGCACSQPVSGTLAYKQQHGTHVTYCMLAVPTAGAGVWRCGTH